MATETSIQKQDSPVTRVERTRSGRAFVPTVDIIEKPDELLLLADVPGATADAIDIHYEKGELSIHATVTPRQDEEKTTYLLNEYGVGDFFRAFQIGEGIDQSKIEAEVKNGVLTLHLPKTQAIKPRKIAVKGG